MEGGGEGHPQTSPNPEPLPTPTGLCCAAGGVVWMGVQWLGVGWTARLALEGWGGTGLGLSP